MESGGGRGGEEREEEMAVTVEGRRGGKGEDRETPKAALTPLRSARDQNRGQNNAAFSEEAPQPYSRSITERYMDDITLPSFLPTVFIRYYARTLPR